MCFKGAKFYYFAHNSFLVGSKMDQTQNTMLKGEGRGKGKEGKGKEGKGGKGFPKAPARGGSKELGPRWIVAVLRGRSVNLRFAV